ncbi:MAG: C45 family autoproteolytic acyltransferase/hydrolase [Terracidiphilus sp.]|nr:C45 family autoproteolytic acyltransferase/hydrolase [Terracidiphilus sp.]
MRFARLCAQSWCICLVLLLVTQAQAAKPKQKAQPASPAYRFERGGWTYVHLEGSPSEIGYQHGRLLAAEIADLVRVNKLELEHGTHRNWEFFRQASRTALWPHIEAEYQQELEGIAKGVQSKGVKLDVWDVVALNAAIELSEYYVPWLDKNTHAENAPLIHPRGRCSAFIATGSYTKDGRIVVAHNNWSSYADGERWTIIFDIKPAHGHRMILDGEPGVITSEDDFGLNDAGLMITETTITQFAGWNEEGIPEFVRSRKAMQYAGTIDEYIALIKQGNNGGYANDWMIGDRRTGEIAYLELGLKNTPVWRSRDGYFISSNFARDPALIKNETDGFDPTNLASSPNARRVTWEDKMAQSKGHIDVELAEKFLANHEDSYTGKVNADSRSLCGHIDRDEKGVPEWEDPPFYPDGAVTGKVTDSELAAHMGMIARAGHPCGEDFLVDPFMNEHPEFKYLRPILKDMKAGPWTLFHSGESQ